MTQISVIIPVYNTEKYIKKCLESVKNQTYKNYEIIIVNDGSTDDSEKIIKEWQEENKDVLVKYFYKENDGLSSARNFGIEKASGKYFMLLDSDDYLDINLFKNIEKYLNEEVDLIKIKMRTVNENGDIIEKIDGPVFEKCSGEEAFKKFVGKENFLDVACIYFYRRDFFVENNFQYNTINKYHEDFGLTPLVVVNAKTLVSTDFFGYYYTQTNNSITRNKDYNKTIHKAQDVLAHYDNMLEKLKGYCLKKETEELLKAYYTNTVVLKTNELKEPEKTKFIKEIKARKMYKNIKARNFKQFIKRYLLKINVKLYLKIR